MKPLELTTRALNSIKKNGWETTTNMLSSIFALKRGTQEIIFGKNCVIINASLSQNDFDMIKLIQREIFLYLRNEGQII